MLQEARTEDEGDYKCVLTNEHGEASFICLCFLCPLCLQSYLYWNISLQVEYAFKFYVTVEGGMDFRAMLMKRKVNNTVKTRNKVLKIQN